MAESKIKYSCEYKEHAQTVTNGTFYFRRYNNMVFIQCISTVTTLAGQYNGWFTAPEDFRPSKNQYIPCLIGGSANIVAMVHISPTGTVSLYSATAVSGQTSWVSGCYMLN